MGVSAKLENNQSTRLERNVHHAGQQRTKRAIVSQPSAFASRQHSCPQRVRVLSYAQNARILSASAMRVGQVRASTRQGTTRASVSRSWVFAKLVKNQSTLLARSARLVGPRRTRHVCASRQLDFVTRMIK